MAFATRRIVIKVAVAGVILLAAGCSSSSPGTAAGTGAGTGTSARVVTVPSLGQTSNSLVLPLTPYYPSPQQMAGMESVRSSLISRCVREFGFNYPALIFSPVEYGADPGLGQFYDFGITSMAFAQRYGYHDTEMTNPVRTATGAPMQRFFSLPAAEQAAGRSCADKIDGETGYLNSTWFTLVQNLAISAGQNAKTAPSVLAVFKKWSSCMAAKGFDYATPLSAVLNQHGNSDAVTGWNTTAPTELEIQTATTDVACKEKVGLLQTWIGVLVADQSTLLPANLPQLRANMAKFRSIYSKELQLLAKGS